MLKTIGRRPTPHQQAILDVAGERLDGPGSPWAYTTVIVIVGRRCGKTVTTMGLPLLRALDGPIDLPNGRRVPFRAAHTAQNLVRARDRFLEDLAEPYLESLDPELRRQRTQLLRNLANTTLTLHPKDHRHPDASSIQVFAPTRSSMRSAGLAHIAIDEAMVFTADQGEELLASARPTMAEFHGRAQMWIVSNVGLTMGDWLPLLRDRGRAAVTQGRRQGILYVEFSMPDDADPADEQVWWDCYPALRDGLVDVQALRDDLELLGRDVFAAEYLDHWPAGDDGGQPAIDPNTWLRLVRPGAAITPGATMHGGVDVAPDGSDLMLVAVGPDSTGKQLAQIARWQPYAGQRQIADLLIDWHQARPNLAKIGYDPRTCATAATWAQDAGVPMAPVDGARWGQALRDLTDRIAHGLGHPHAAGEPAHDVLLRHLATARARDGEVRMLSRKHSRGSISGVVALMCAVHLAGQEPETQPFAIR
jgi:hypothetical protein